MGFDFGSITKEIKKGVNTATNTTKYIAQKPLNLLGGAGKTAGSFAGLLGSGIPSIPGIPGLPGGKPPGDDPNAGLIGMLLEMLGLPDVKTLALYAGIGLAGYVVIMRIAK